MVSAGSRFAPARRLVWLPVALAALALIMATGVAAKPGGGGLVTKLAGQACVQQKHQVGNRAFRKRYGQRPMPTCIKKKRAEARRAVTVATEDCQDELDAWGAEDFFEDWDSFDECIADWASSSLGGGSDDEEEPDEDDDELL